MRRLRLLVLVMLLVATADVLVASRHLAPTARGGGVPGPGCEGGLILDDGSFETAYGWVPSAEWGEYVQTFQLGASTQVVLESVCVCWTRTRVDDSLEFELEVYEDVEGVPAAEPLIVVPSSMAQVPEWTEGRFTEVPLGVGAPVLNPGTYHIGVRWGPTVNQYFFVCADQSNPDAPVSGYFRDDRSEGEWAWLLDASDPIFADHTAMLVRVRTRDVVATPAIGPGGAGILVFVIALLAVWRLRNRWP